MACMVGDEIPSFQPVPGPVITADDMGKSCPHCSDSLLTGQGIRRTDGAGWAHNVCALGAPAQDLVPALLAVSGVGRCVLPCLFPALAFAALPDLSLPTRLTPSPPPPPIIGTGCG